MPNSTTTSTSSPSASTAAERAIAGCCSTACSKAPWPPNRTPTTRSPANRPHSQTPPGIRGAKWIPSSAQSTQTPAGGFTDQDTAVRQITGAGVSAGGVPSLGPTAAAWQQSDRIVGGPRARARCYDAYHVADSASPDYETDRPARSHRPADEHERHRSAEPHAQTRRDRSPRCPFAAGGYRGSSRERVRPSHRTPRATRRAPRRAARSGA